jgi:hypothetical protein
LLIVPRTAALGALCFLVIILNIVLINFGYDIALDVKILSCVLLALDGVLLVHYRQRYRLLLLSDAVLDQVLKLRSETPTVDTTPEPKCETAWICGDG